MSIDVDYQGQSSTLYLAEFWSSETGLTMDSEWANAGRIPGKHLASSGLFPGFVPLGDPVWAAGGDCASGSMVWPCVPHPPL